MINREKKVSKRRTLIKRGKTKSFLRYIISIQTSDGSGTRKPENPTRHEGFLLTRTRPVPEKNISNPPRPEPEKLQTRPENPKTPRYAKNMYFYQNIHKVFTEKVRPKFFL